MTGANKRQKQESPDFYKLESNTVHVHYFLGSYISHVYMCMYIYICVCVYMCMYTQPARGRWHPPLTNQYMKFSGQETWDNMHDAGGFCVPDHLVSSTSYTI